MVKRTTPRTCRRRHTGLGVRPISEKVGVRPAAFGPFGDNFAVENVSISGGDDTQRANMSWTDWGNAIVDLTAFASTVAGPTWLRAHAAHQTVPGRRTRASGNIADAAPGPVGLGNG